MVIEWPRIIMVGWCPNCGAHVVSRYPFQIGECKCKNPHTEVPLQFAIIPSPKIQKALQKVSDFSGVPVEKLAEAVKRGLMIKYGL